MFNGWQRVLSIQFPYETCRCRWIKFFDTNCVALLIVSVPGLFFNLNLAFKNGGRDSMRIRGMVGGGALNSFTNLADFFIDETEQIVRVTGGVSCRVGSFF